MCELYICNVTHVHADPTKDRRGSYKPGMVISIAEDGWEWSESEKNGPHLIVKAKDIPKSLMEKWIEEEIDNPALPANEQGTWRRRRFVINMASLTPTAISNLENAVIAPATRVAALDLITEDKTVTEPH